MKIVYLFGKFGDFSKKPYGGGEVGNRRTKKILEDLEYQVIPIHRYCNYKKKSFLVYMDMIFGDIISVLKMAFMLLLKSRKNSVVHISGFTGAYMPIEYCSVCIAKLLGFKVIYEIRGGGIIQCYNEGSVLYKKLFHYTVNMADHIWSQGMENKDLICSNTKSRFFYYPNCVSEEFMPHQCPIKEKKILRLVYMGRINPSKNVDVILQTVLYLKNKGISLILDIIGGATDCPEYLEKLQAFVAKNKLQNEVFFRGQLDKPDMVEYLKSAVFFLFPTQEKREGQSNSLTELMSFGIIPIASSQGYNRTIIDCDDLIENNLTAESYGNKIIDVLNTKRIDSLSKEMYLRIKSHFTYSAVRDKVKFEYNEIFRNI